jgi:glycosyltransferase involved in cell wall biosynthesis/FMN phosphatase YigB (HAD superfamily)
MNNIELNKKISIIIPVYNSEDFLNTCLDSLTKQSYKNLEIILVNDGSPKNCKEIVSEYMKKDERVKYVEHEKNKGLFQARITGFENSTGDYIAFLDADDYVSGDFYRELIQKAEETNSDIVFGKTVLDYGKDNRRIYNLFDFPFEELKGEECYEAFYDQEGLNFAWHITSNKIYSRKIWKKAVVEYKKVNKHLIMTEDFAFSNVVFYYARKVTKVDRVAFFYTKHDGASTSVNDLSFKKANKNIEDLTTSFSFVENFLKEKGVYEKYKEKFEKWRALYCQMHKSYILNMKFSKEEKEELEEKFNKFCPKQFEIQNSGFFSSIDTLWNDGLDKLKEKVMDDKTKVVSFDIFDTLITRPFLYPKDLFTFLNENYRKLSNNLGIDFSKIREDCEVLARTEAHEQNKEEVNLDRIYEIIQEEYDIPKEILNVLKNKEIELELRFCKRRETAYSIYELAKYLGKRVICTSDMYLPLATIKEILDKNGFTNIDKIYLSCDVMKTKATGNLYDYVINEENIESEEMVHIGDNYHSDYEVAKKHRINSIYFPKTTDIMLDKNTTNNLTQMLYTSMPFWRDNQASMNFIGIRSMLAVAANKYFDNPFRVFNTESDFNIDPYLIGYYAVGMYMFGVGNWLLRETSGKSYKNLVFMARDGYLPMEVYNILKKYYTNVPEARYLRVSRKALISAMIINKIDLYKLTDVINIENHTPKYIIKYIKESIKNISEEEIKNIIEKTGIKYEEDIKTIQKFNKLVKVISDELFDEEKNNLKIEKLKKYFGEFYQDKSATFDLGYSGRPELYLSVLCGKPIDTYFLNINQGEAIKYSQTAGYNLTTYFDAKPSVTGFAYESIISELAPSTIGYDFTGDVKPILEKANKTYQERYVIGIIQNAAKQFVKDVLDIFGDEYKKLYYQDYYISLPFVAYINSSKPIDMLVFNSIGFEDTVRLKEIKPITEEWMKERGFRNQREMNALINIGPIGVKNNSYLDYNNVVDLENHSKLVRLLFYALYDRPTFKRRMREIFKNHRGILKVGKVGYSAARETKNAIYKGIHKIKGGK